MSEIFSTRFGARQRYQGRTRAPAEPVLCDGLRSGIPAHKRGKWICVHPRTSGGNVNRNFVTLGITALAFAGALFAGRDRKLGERRYYYIRAWDLGYDSPRHRRVNPRPLFDN